MLKNKKWYRKLFPNETFVRVNGKWKNRKNYKQGKVEDVDGKWNTQAFCSCGNELVHSKSYKSHKYINLYAIYEYECSNCGKIQYYNASIIPGLLECDILGEPLRDKEPSSFCTDPKEKCISEECAELGCKNREINLSMTMSQRLEKEEFGYKTL